MAAIEEFIILTTAAPAAKKAMNGPHSVNITGTFGSGTIVEYGYTVKGGRAEGVETGITAVRTYISESPYSEFVMSGSTGATVTIVFTPIINHTLGG